ncbi:glycosyltransferase family 4 protein [Tropicibacter oceani]|uniref:Glycosyltransferase family 4 protein n=1 Tax=Tropicibacter oceani TaxID=3058420 RepID=A0ABY8QCQ6_9RHOB|nr:glycosyltransferase family 4 protein [Tropicibacter oceani]WGW02405.1 glycosyltransferase family 4 protein [Tropicibacter oceani]
MSHRPTVLHLVDDTTPGGVTRVLDHIRRCPQMARDARHEIRPVSRRAPLPSCQADLVVSHLAISWRSLPRLISFRARHAATPIVHVEHSYTERFTALNVAARGRFFTLLRTAYALFDRVVAVSAPQGAWLSRRRLVQSQRLVVIPPVVDLAPFRQIPAATGPVRRFGAIGRLHPQKGFDLLIQAFCSLPEQDIALDICGSGPDLEALRALAGDDRRIVFKPHVAAPQHAFEAVDMVLIPSRWEAFGLVALEARAAGRPVLTSGVDGLVDSAGPGARHVTGQGAEAWAEALSAVLDGPPAPLCQTRAQQAEADFADRWKTLLIAPLVAGEAAARPAGLPALVGDAA